MNRDALAEIISRIDDAQTLKSITRACKYLYARYGLHRPNYRILENGRKHGIVINALPTYVDMTTYYNGRRVKHRTVFGQYDVKYLLRTGTTTYLGRAISCAQTHKGKLHGMFTVHYMGHLIKLVTYEHGARHGPYKKWSGFTYEERAYEADAVVASYIYYCRPTFAAKIE